MGSDYLLYSTPAKPTTHSGEGKEPYKRKKGGASPLLDDAPPLLYPYSFSFFFSSCSFFHWANSRWPSSLSKKARISGSRHLAMAST